MDQNQQLAVAQMRESVQKLGSSTEGYGDPTLMRFLIARSLDTEKAAKMFVQWQKWRVSFVPLDYIPDSEVADELNGEKIYLQELSRKGYPVVIVKANKHYPSKDQPQFKKSPILAFVIWSFWRSDLSKSPFENCFQTKTGYLRWNAYAYYPERLAKLYLLNMPGFFVRVWRLVSRFLEKATQEKVVIVSNEEERREMVRDIGEEALPEDYGGQAKLMLLQHFQLKLLDD
ncbi:hypothetical protein DH2020_043817 [Rehmannia glutinosa]|uniref:CRAL-TRIO domain-containing protein n=1 Tax=Rehmannia glutinosa TaxID=99300 RepID=A0ABR0UK87_REHGL